MAEPVRLIIFAKIEHCREEFGKGYSKGWYMHLEGSHEAIYVGETDNGWKVGDEIRITFEKVD